MAAGQSGLQVHFRPTVCRGGLQTLAAAQPGRRGRAEGEVSVEGMGGPASVGIGVLTATVYLSGYIESYINGFFYMFCVPQQWTNSTFMACCEVISFFIVLGYNEIKFKCACLRLTTQNEIPTQHSDPNRIYLSMSCGYRVGAGVRKGSPVLSSNANRDIK